MGLTDFAGIYQKIFPHSNVLQNENNLLTVKKVSLT